MSAITVLASGRRFFLSTDHSQSCWMVYSFPLALPFVHKEKSSSAVSTPMIVYQSLRTCASRRSMTKFTAHCAPTSVVPRKAMLMAMIPKPVANPKCGTSLVVLQDISAWDHTSPTCASITMRMHASGTREAKRMNLLCWLKTRGPRYSRKPFSLHCSDSSWNSSLVSSSLELTQACTFGPHMSNTYSMSLVFHGDMSNLRSWPFPWWRRKGTQNGFLSA
mmetsp:Transcript_92923/g.200940  ORF Transcript_92923/g.200940 Transcript_92923/m.200940 type:complete len:220 (-) Transcript_92923:849-1508(-)